jgi:hypothetical protein
MQLLTAATVCEIILRTSATLLVAVIGKVSDCDQIDGKPSPFSFTQRSHMRPSSSVDRLSDLRMTIDQSNQVGDNKTVRLA